MKYINFKIEILVLFRIAVKSKGVDAYYIAAIRKVHYFFIIILI